MQIQCYVYQEVSLDNKTIVMNKNAVLPQAWNIKQARDYNHVDHESGRFGIEWTAGRTLLSVLAGKLNPAPDPEIPPRAKCVLPSNRNRV